MRRSMLWSSAQALAEIGDPIVIPTMIAVIASDDTYDTVYGVGYFGLGKLTGVKYDEGHDGDWWRAWWGDREVTRAVGDLPAGCRRAGGLGCACAARASDPRPPPGSP